MVRDTKFDLNLVHTRPENVGTTQSRATDPRRDEENGTSPSFSALSSYARL